MMGQPTTNKEWFSNVLVDNDFTLNDGISIGNVINMKLRQWIETSYCTEDPWMILHTDNYEQAIHVSSWHPAPLCILYINGRWLWRFKHMVLPTLFCCCALGLMAFDRYQSQHWLPVQSHNQEWADRLSASYQQQLYHRDCSDVLIIWPYTSLTDTAWLCICLRNPSWVYVPQQYISGFHILYTVILYVIYTPCKVWSICL